MWASQKEKIGAGFFRDRFLSLFGEGLEHLSACLDAWSFLVPTNDDRLVVGRNAYGAIAYVDDTNGATPRLRIVDPLRVEVIGASDLDLWRFIARFLPAEPAPHVHRRLALPGVASRKSPRRGARFGARHQGAASARRRVGARPLLGRIDRRLLPNDRAHLREGFRGNEDVVSTDPIRGGSRKSAATGRAARALQHAIGARVDALVHVARGDGRSSSRLRRSRRRQASLLQCPKS